MASNIESSDKDNGGVEGSGGGKQMEKRRRGRITLAPYLELRMDALVNACWMESQRNGEKSIHLVVLLVDQLNLKVLVLENLKKIKEDTQPRPWAW